MDASTPGKRRYPWLDNSSDDDNHPSPSGGQTSHLVVATDVTSPPLAGVGPESCEPGPEAVPEPDRNPEEIVLDEEQSEGEEGGATDVGAKVTEDKPVIKRRNLAMYQSQDSD